MPDKASRVYNAAWHGLGINRLEPVAVGLGGDAEMKKIDAVLREKELQLEAVRREVQALRAVAPLLNEEAGIAPKIPPQSEQVTSRLDGTTGAAEKES